MAHFECTINRFDAGKVRKLAEKIAFKYDDFKFLEDKSIFESTFKFQGSELILKALLSLLKKYFEEDEPEYEGLDELA